MNPKVEEFINKMKEEQEKQKKEHLISLGLIDESKSIEAIEYYDVWDGTNECKWIPNEQKYRKIVQRYGALDVTDEEYKEILKYAPINKTQMSEDAKSKKKFAPQIKWSNVICAISIIIAIVSIIIGIIYACVEDSFMAIIWVVIYLAVYVPYAIGFARIVEAVEKYLQK